MLSIGIVVLAGLLWLGVLFGSALVRRMLKKIQRLPE